MATAAKPTFTDAGSSTEVDLSREAVAVCVDLAAMGPQETIAAYVASGHARIGRALGAARGFAVLAVKYPRPPEDDPLLGWRIDLCYDVGPKSAAQIVAVEKDVREETYLDDPLIRITCEAAGRHRVEHVADPRKLAAYRTTIAAKYWTMFALRDRLKAIHALSPSTELHLSFDRASEDRPFGDREVRLLDLVTSGIAPWAQRFALMVGRLEGLAALSPREREVANGLLGHANVKNIAADLSIGEARARELIRSVYRKLRVNGRLELANKWASAVVPSAPLGHTTAVGRRR
ncbi:MAG: hypothetical protein KF894_12335 [Labilithrix sp.]|nr:hypothetical protein [Labilithrix sp.]